MDKLWECEIKIHFGTITCFFSWKKKIENNIPKHRFWCIYFDHESLFWSWTSQLVELSYHYCHHNCWSKDVIKTRPKGVLHTFIHTYIVHQGDFYYIGYLGGEEGPLGGHFAGSKGLKSLNALCNVALPSSVCLTANYQMAFFFTLKSINFLLQ